MREDAFSEMYNKIQRIFEKSIRPENKAACYLEVRNIPDIAVDFITRKIISGNDYPKNLINAIYFQFGKYKEQHPDKFTTRFDDRCTHCDECGCIYGWKKDQYGFWDMSIGMCAACQPNEEKKTTKDAMEKAGYVVIRKKTLHEAHMFFSTQNGKLQCRKLGVPYEPERFRKQRESLLASIGKESSPRHPGEMLGMSVRPKEVGIGLLGDNMPTLGIQDGKKADSDVPF